MRVTNMVPDVQYWMDQSEQALATSQQEVSTGRRVNQLADDPAASARMVRLENASSDVDQYHANVSAASARMQTADSALSAVVTSLNQALTLGTSGANSTMTASNRQGIAAQVQGILSTVISQANATYQGSYLFGGTLSQTPPFVNASTTMKSSGGSTLSPLSLTTALTAGSVTTVQDAATGATFSFRASAADTVGTLNAALNAAVTAGTLSAGTTLSVDATGNVEIGPNTASSGLFATTNDAVLGSFAAVAGTAVTGAYVYRGNSGVNSVKVGDSLSVQTNLPGDQIFTAGPNVVGALQKLVRGLNAGSANLIETAVSQLSDALNYVGAQRVPLGSTVSQLQSQDSYLSQESVTLSSQETAAVGIDLAKAATDLSQAELVHSAVLAVAAKVLPQTLLDYLH